MANKIATKTLDTNALIKQSTNMETALSSVVKMSSDEESLKKALKNEASKNFLVKTVTSFATFDLRFQGGMKGIGEFCYKVRSMDDAVQRELIGAICESNGLEPTDSTGRTGLAYALFGKDKSMLVVTPPNKDTRAGMRITAYESAYKKSLKGEKHGGKQGPNAGTGTNGTTGTGTGTESTSKTPRSAKALFVALMEQATEKEQLLLMRLARKAELDIPNEWLGDDEETENGKA